MTPNIDCYRVGAAGARTSIWELPKHWGCLIGGLHNSGYCVLGSILRAFMLGNYHIATYVLVGYIGDAFSGLRKGGGKRPREF